ncbi:hypothetical protein [Cohnella mopanensis]|uniref:hypothetical protein n=1 Tax=Cohnella mopanensis TaxID=2911966 RepID=UPI001EF81108|nr:hypothetical protein [Cohnella mopanensis]
MGELNLLIIGLGLESFSAIEILVVAKVALVVATVHRIEITTAVAESEIAKIFIERLRERNELPE